MVAGVPLIMKLREFQSFTPCHQLLGVDTRVKIHICLALKSMQPKKYRMGRLRGKAGDGSVLPSVQG